MKNASRDRRSLAAVAFTAVCLALLRTPPAKAVDPEHWLTPSKRAVARPTMHESGVPPPPHATPHPTALLEREGAVLYATHCSTCHGVDLRGAPGAPTLMQAGGAATDFYLNTGRMPIALRSAAKDDGAPVGQIMARGPQDFHTPPHFDAEQIAALDAYVTSHAQQTIPIPDVKTDPALLVRGRRVFENNCEQCHGAGAQGATVGYQYEALPLDLASPIQIGEAIRIGPGVMPRFSPEQLSDRDVDAVATYVRYLTTVKQDYGGTVMGYIGPSAEGVVGAFGGVGLLFWVVYFTGTKTDGRRVNELDPPVRD